MASGESTELETEDSLTAPKVQNSILEETNVDTSVNNDNRSSSLQSFWILQRKSVYTENSDVETISEKKVGERKKFGHLRILKDGQLTFKNINSSLIIESTQLGIRETVRRLANCPERDVLMKDFMTEESFPIHTEVPEPYSLKKSSSFKTYAPIAFRHFRELFGIKPEDFVSSFCDHPLVELPNPGASGSLIYLTHDDKFIIKTVQHKEADFLQKLLPGYYLNLNQNPLTLLPKFFGLYCFKCDSKVRLAVTNNILPRRLKIHQKYDLKGSTFKRKASVKEVQKDFPTFKDLDFIEHHPEGIFLENNVYRNLMKTIERDCTVLESFQIIDYSLLVGVHNLDQAKRENIPILEEEKLSQEEVLKNLPSGDGGINVPSRVSNIGKIQEHQRSDSNVKLPTFVRPPNTTAKVTEGNFTFTGFPGRKPNGENLLLYIGIIDILQSYRLKKRLEHAWKSIVHNGDEVSVHNPAFYSRRFQDFTLNKVFKTLSCSPRSSNRKSVYKPKASDMKTEPTIG